jgi:protein LTV1
VRAAEEKHKKQHELPEVLDWTMAARLMELRMNQESDSSDFEGSDAELEDTVPSMKAFCKKPPKKDLLSNFSMSSSVLTRTSHLELLDNRFDRVELDYADEEIGAVEIENPQMNREQRDYVNDLMDEFLLKHSVTSHNTLQENLKPQGGGIGQYDQVRKMLRMDDDGSIIPINLDNYRYVEVKERFSDGDDDALPKPFIIEDKYNETRWDCETVLSSYTNFENHPKMISERRRKLEGPVINLDKKSGLPICSIQHRFAQPQGQELESNDEAEDSLPINLGEARPKEEDKDEKRLRKQGIKEAKREKRAAKKELKEAFKLEKNNQVKEAIRLKAQTKGLVM